MKNKQDKGFTLVELLIVIVILGILATVTVFAVGGITDRATENTCAVEFATVQTAVEAFFVDSGGTGYPASIAALSPDYLREPPTNTFTYDASTGEVTNTC
jgi:prepilin-type N-terminal cleavage/methylation domain-containing protein